MLVASRRSTDRARTPSLGDVERPAAAKGALSVALIGCGQIADAHLQQVQRTGLARVVAVCDREPDLARQAAARFGVPAEYTDPARMLRDVRPDIVHIATPPATHCDLLLKAVQAGAHAYVEKPFALTLDETDHMLAAAASCKRLVCVGHDRLFDPVWIELRRRIAAGEVGEIAHVDCVQLYDLNGRFGRLVLTDPSHWVQCLPGGLLQNAVPHDLAAISELLSDPHPAIAAVAWGRERHGEETELRVLVRGAKVTASLTFLTTGGPPGNYLRVYGTSGWLEADYEARVVRRRPAPALPSLLVKLAVPLRQCQESARAFARNVVRFSRADLHYFAGMQALLGAFYRAVLDGTPSPIAADRVRKVAALMEEVSRARTDSRGTPLVDAAPLVQL
jgi:predicted dehydrogenase